MSATPGSPNYPGQWVDIPASGWTHAGVADEINAIASTLGTNPQGGSASVAARLTALSGASSGLRPHQFKVSDYGALGDGKFITDVGTTNGSGVLTSPSGGFAGAQVGQWVMVTTSDDTTRGQITTVTSSTQVTIGVNATATGTGYFAVWGTDDTAAINNALVAARDYAEAQSFYAEVLLDDKIYISATMNSVSNTHEVYNTQIHIPSPSNNNGRKLVLALKGVGRTDHLQYWNATVPMLAGSIIVSMLRVAAGQDGSQPYQSVIGTSWAGTDMGTSNIFVNVKPVIENLAVVVPYKSQLTGLDFFRVGGFYADGVSVFAFCNGYHSGTGLDLNSWYTTFGTGGETTAGLRTPDYNNNADCTIGHISFEGLWQGIVLSSEHLTIGSIKAIYMGIVLALPGATTGHGTTIDRVTAEAYQGGISVLTAGAGVIPLKIGMWNTEVMPSAYDIHDVGNALYGEIAFCDPVDTSGGVGRAPVVQGAGNLRVVNLNLGRGNWSSAPAVPASTTDQQNIAWRDASVSLIGGTVSDVKVDGVTVASGSNTTVVVPSGKNITLTYTAAPTWVWTLL